MTMESELKNRTIGEHFITVYQNVMKKKVTSVVMKMHRINWRRIRDNPLNTAEILINH